MMVRRCGETESRLIGLDLGPKLSARVQARVDAMGGIS